MQGITSIDYLYCFSILNTYLSGSEVCELLFDTIFLAQNKTINIKWD